MLDNAKKIKVDPAPGILMSRVLDDGRLLSLIPLTYGRMRITVGGNYQWYEDGW